jgi:uncharacterized surface protein with fasciclin (FAS1) repeats
MNLKLILSLSAIASVVLGKNVVDLRQRDWTAAQPVEREIQDRNADEFHNDKRDPKNVVNLGSFQKDVEEQAHEKREPKNVVDLKKVHNDKRDPKNVKEFKKFPKDYKREPKNVVDLKKVGHDKREPKNVVNLKKLAHDKREPKNVVDFKKIPHDKREPKNIVNLGKFQEDVENQAHEKKDGMNAVLIKQLKRLEEQVLFKIDEHDCHENILQSILPQVKDISIFAGYIRDNEYVSKKTELTDETTIIIAPSDDAIINKLQGKKPWEFPNPIGGENPDENASKNINSFVFGHVIENFEDNLQIESHSVVAKLLNGNTLRIKQDSSHKFLIQLNDNDWIQVKQVKQVDNGFVFVIDDCLVKP